MAKKEKRFVKTYRQDTLGSSTEIWVDRETGVNYMLHTSGGVCGLTPLLDRDGRPIITTVYDEE